MSEARSALCLWFKDRADEAAQFYCDLFPDSKMGSVERSPSDYPGGKEGDVLLANFTLLGMQALALNGNPGEFSDAVSMQVFTDTQEETDRYWAALTADGGGEMACSWCFDRFGMRWQIVPRVLGEGLADPDPAARKRVYEAMMGMVKIDHAAIEAARRGD